MKALTWSLITAVGVLLVACGEAHAGSLTAADMFLDPSLIPSANYTYSYSSPGFTASFTNVTGLQVMPALQNGSNAYYFTPTVDYTGDITGTTGSITFNRPGPYFVLATSTSGAKTLSDYGIGFQVFPETKGPSRDWHQTPVPDADTYITDPSLAKSNPKFKKGSTVKNDLATWDDVLKYMKTLKNAHVELGGHGAPGQFYYNDKLVLDSSMLGTLDDLKGHVECLTFMSCSTAVGDAGASFLQGVADKLGTSGGYTNVVGGNGTDWFVNDSGKEITFSATPEPCTLLLTGFGVASLLGYGWRGRKRTLAA